MTQHLLIEVEAGAEHTPPIFYVVTDNNVRLLIGAFTDTRSLVERAREVKRSWDELRAGGSATS